MHRMLYVQCTATTVTNMERNILILFYILAVVIASSVKMQTEDPLNINIPDKHKRREFIRKCCGHRSCNLNTTKYFHKYFSLFSLSDETVFQKTNRIKVKNKLKNTKFPLHRKKSTFTKNRKTMTVNKRKTTSSVLPSYKLKSNNHKTTTNLQDKVKSTQFYKVLRTEKSNKKRINKRITENKNFMGTKMSFPVQYSKNTTIYEYLASSTQINKFDYIHPGKGKRLGHILDYTKMTTIKPNKRYFSPKMKSDVMTFIVNPRESMTQKPSLYRHTQFVFENLSRDLKYSNYDIAKNLYTSSQNSSIKNDYNNLTFKGTILTEYNSSIDFININNWSDISTIYLYSTSDAININSIWRITSTPWTNYVVCTTISEELMYREIISTTKGFQFINKYSTTIYTMEQFTPKVTKYSTSSFLMHKYDTNKVDIVTSEIYYNTLIAEACTKFKQLNTMSLKSLYENRTDMNHVFSEPNSNNNLQNNYNINIEKIHSNIYNVTENIDTSFLSRIISQSYTYVISTTNKYFFNVSTETSYVFYSVSSETYNLLNISSLYFTTLNPAYGDEKSEFKADNTFFTINEVIKSTKPYNDFFERKNTNKKRRFKYGSIETHTESYNSTITKKANQNYLVDFSTIIYENIQFSQSNKSIYTISFVANNSRKPIESSFMIDVTTYYSSSVSLILIYNFSTETKLTSNYSGKYIDEYYRYTTMTTATYKPTTNVESTIISPISVKIAEEAVTSNNTFSSSKSIFPFLTDTFQHKFTSDVFSTVPSKKDAMSSHYFELSSNRKNIYEQTTFSSLYSTEVCTYNGYNVEKIDSKPASITYTVLTSLSTNSFETNQRLYQNIFSTKNTLNVTQNNITNISAPFETYKSVMSTKIQQILANETLVTKNPVSRNLNLAQNSSVTYFSTASFSSKATTSLQTLRDSLLNDMDDELDDNENEVNDTMDTWTNLPSSTSVLIQTTTQTTINFDPDDEGDDEEDLTNHINTTLTRFTMSLSTYSSIDMFSTKLNNIDPNIGKHFENTNTKIYETTTELQISSLTSNDLPVKNTPIAILSDYTKLATEDSKAEPKRINQTKTSALSSKITIEPFLETTVPALNSKFSNFLVSNDTKFDSKFDAKYKITVPSFTESIFINTSPSLTVVGGYMFTTSEYMVVEKESTAGNNNVSVSSKILPTHSGTIFNKQDLENSKNLHLLLNSSMDSKIKDEVTTSISLNNLLTKTVEVTSDATLDFDDEADDIDDLKVTKIDNFVYVTQITNKTKTKVSSFNPSEIKSSDLLLSTVKSDKIAPNYQSTVTIVTGIKNDETHIKNVSTLNMTSNIKYTENTDFVASNFKTVYASDSNVSLTNPTTLVDKSVLKLSKPTSPIELETSIKTLTTLSFKSTVEITEQVPGNNNTDDGAKNVSSYLSLLLNTDTSFIETQTIAIHLTSKIFAITTEENKLSTYDRKFIKLETQPLKILSEIISNSANTIAVVFGNAKNTTPLTTEDMDELDDNVPGEEGAANIIHSSIRRIKTKIHSNISISRNLSIYFNNMSNENISVFTKGIEEVKSTSNAKIPILYIKTTEFSKVSLINTHQGVDLPKDLLNSSNQSIGLTLTNEATTQITNTDGTDNFNISENSNMETEDKKASKPSIITSSLTSTLVTAHVANASLVDEVKTRREDMKDVKTTTVEFLGGSLTKSKEGTVKTNDFPTEKLGETVEIHRNTDKYIGVTTTTHHKEYVNIDKTRTQSDVNTIVSIVESTILPFTNFRAIKASETDASDFKEQSRSSTKSESAVITSVKTAVTFVSTVRVNDIDEEDDLEDEVHQNLTTKISVAISTVSSSSSLKADDDDEKDDLENEDKEEKDLMTTKTYTIMGTTKLTTTTVTDATQNKNNYTNNGDHKITVTMYVTATSTTIENTFSTFTNGNAKYNEEKDDSENEEQEHEPTTTSRPNSTIIPVSLQQSKSNLSTTSNANDDNKKHDSDIKNEIKEDKNSNTVIQSHNSTTIGENTTKAYIKDDVSFFNIKNESTISKSNVTSKMLETTNISIISTQQDSNDGDEDEKDDPENDIKLDKKSNITLLFNATDEGKVSKNVESTITKSFVTSKILETTKLPITSTLQDLTDGDEDEKDDPEIDVIEDKKIKAMVNETIVGNGSQINGSTIPVSNIASKIIENATISITSLNEYTEHVVKKDKNLNSTLSFNATNDSTKESKNDESTIPISKVTFTILETTLVSTLSSKENSNKGDKEVKPDDNGKGDKNVNTSLKLNTTYGFQEIKNDKTTVLKSNVTSKITETTIISITSTGQDSDNGEDDEKDDPEHDVKEDKNLTTTLTFNAINVDNRSKFDESTIPKANFTSKILETTKIYTSFFKEVSTDVDKDKNVYPGDDVKKYTKLNITQTFNTTNVVNGSKTDEITIPKSSIAPKIIETATISITSQKEASDDNDEDEKDDPVNEVKEDKKSNTTLSINATNIGNESKNDVLTIPKSNITSTILESTKLTTSSSKVDSSDGDEDEKDDPENEVKEDKNRNTSLSFNATNVGNGSKNDVSTIQKFNVTSKILETTKITTSSSKEESNDGDEDEKDDPENDESTILKSNISSNILETTTKPIASQKEDSKNKITSKIIDTTTISITTQKADSDDSDADEKDDPENDESTILKSSVSSKILETTIVSTLSSKKDSNDGDEDEKDDPENEDEEDKKSSTTLTLKTTNVVKGNTQKNSDTENEESDDNKEENDETTTTKTELTSKVLEITKASIKSTEESSNDESDDTENSNDETKATKEGSSKTLPSTEAESTVADKEEAEDAEDTSTTQVTTSKNIESSSKSEDKNEDVEETENEKEGESENKDKKSDDEKKDEDKTKVEEKEKDEKIDDDKKEETENEDEKSDNEKKDEDKTKTEVKEKNEKVDDDTKGEPAKSEPTKEKSEDKNEEKSEDKDEESAKTEKSEDER